jgi:hypothetical protein
MPARLTGWPAAILATLVTLALVAGELTDAPQRRWWAARPLTTDTVAGLVPDGSCQPVEALWVSDQGRRLSALPRANIRLRDDDRPGPLTTAASR